MVTARESTRRYHVGDWVSFLYGPGRVLAQIVEDRGPLGINRRRLYRVRLGQDSDESAALEMPGQDLQPAPPPDKAAILHYLTGGGLVAILQANLTGGQHPPRVWLTFTRRGDLTHTFIAERGLVGGAAVPFFALHEGKVLAAKQEEVINFLKTFGLARDEAEAVIHGVGTAP